MRQDERRLYLIRWLLDERGQADDGAVPTDERGQKELLRALVNVREAAPIDEEFLRVQDEYLKEEARLGGVVRASELAPLCTTRAGVALCLWQGDITRLECDAIVNAANSSLEGCFIPGHRCIDNCIHTAAGVQLRATCAALIRRQGRQEPTGSAKITPAFNLPCRYVLHTVGPIISGQPTAAQRGQLASCYSSCMSLAAEKGLKSVAFCCISTGVFHFPNDQAAEIAVDTVASHPTGSVKQVVFNVFKDEDRQIYERLLARS